MQSARDIKSRIRSVGNTRQIAKAMEVVSATKMRRGQEVAMGARNFARALYDMFAQMPAEIINAHPLIQPRGGRRELVVVIASDKGLAGVFNSAVIRTAESHIRKSSQEHPVDVITLGKKAREYFKRSQANVIHEYTATGDYTNESQTRIISEHILNRYIQKSCDSITLISTHFISTLRQEVRIQKILPLEQISATDSEKLSYERIFEPSVEAVLDLALPYLFHLKFYEAIINSNAAEHSARMLAMKKAGDNAKEIVSELTLEYNKSRQAAITQEISEIVAGSQSVQ